MISADLTACQFNRQSFARDLSLLNNIQFLLKKKKAISLLNCFKTIIYLKYAIKLIK